MTAPDAWTDVDYGLTDMQRESRDRLWDIPDAERDTDVTIVLGALDQQSARCGRAAEALR